MAETDGLYAWNHWFLRRKPLVSPLGTDGFRRSSQWNLPLGRPNYRYDTPKKCHNMESQTTWLLVYNFADSPIGISNDIKWTKTVK